MPESPVDCKCCRVTDVSSEHELDFALFVSRQATLVSFYTHCRETRMTSRLFARRTQGAESLLRLLLATTNLQMTGEGLSLRNLRPMKKAFPMSSIENALMASDLFKSRLTSCRPLQEPQVLHLLLRSSFSSFLGVPSGLALSASRMDCVPWQIGLLRSTEQYARLASARCENGKGQVES